MHNWRFRNLLAGTALSLVFVAAGGAIPVSAQVRGGDAGAERTEATQRDGMATAPAESGAASVTPATSDAPPQATLATDAQTSVGATPENKSTPAAGETAIATTTSDTKPVADAVLADQELRDMLRGLAGGKFDRLFEGKKERVAVDAFYAARGYAPIWVENGGAGARANAASARLKAAAEDGLDPADYPRPEFRAGANAPELAQAELQLTASVLDYARYASTGRIHFSRIGADISFNLDRPEPEAVLAKLANATDAGAALASFNPPHAGYKALRAKLAETRARKPEAASERIASGPTLAIGMQDARVPLLRARLGLGGDPGERTYDKVLADAVMALQKNNRIPANGKLTAATIAAINGPHRDDEADVIIANMERWRWLPRELGKNYVMVNVPDYTLKVVRGDSTIWATRIVVGKPGRLATPMLTASMQHITINPTWNVPPSIVQNEYLPALAQDRTVLERMGLKLEQNRDGTIRIYQPPGDRNALGRIRFNFPNKFLVYQHDTPDKHLFAHDKRAYSHGCMRVNDPVKYAEVILSIALPNQGWTQERVRKLYGNSEHDVRFPTAIPVHLTYQTAFVDDSGKLIIRDDIYGRDARTLAVLKGPEHKNAHIAVAHPSTTPTASVRAPVGLAFAGADGSSFFERLFGPSDYSPPATRLGRGAPLPGSSNAAHAPGRSTWNDRLAPPR
ncbi:MAG: L,D-transpeptidase family protein [Proteobacteria bacterium]|nr:L,D-transpeptidase family protein [Pseudomonadota bacterium]